jgi:hypothetical protein
MNAPFGLNQGNILLLSRPESFSAAYIRRSLEMCGIAVVVPDGTPEQALASLDPAEWLNFSACIAVDLGQAFLEMLPAQRGNLPFVFVGEDPGQWFGGPYSWLAPPFAAFQVMEVLGEMIARASAAMRASIDAAAADLLQSSARG